MNAYLNGWGAIFSLPIQPQVVTQAQVDIAIVMVSDTLVGYAARPGPIRYPQH